MTTLAATDLYHRGMRTVLAAHAEYARGATGAAVRWLPGVAAAVFPHGPERGVYNNAVLGHDLVATERAAAVDAMETAYAEAGIARFAAWVHESDRAMQADLRRRGYVLAESTRAMGMSLDDLRLLRPTIELGAPDWPEYLRLLEMPPDFLRRADPAAYHIAVAPFGGANAAVAMAFDLDGDRGIYNVATLQHARRHGLATALTAALLHDARDRGCHTASLQSTPMAEGVYEAAGFRDLGRILEYAPADLLA